MYEKTIFRNEEKGFELRVTVSEFKGIDYFHIRKYFQSYEGDYLPSKEGISMPAGITNIYSMLDALIDICSRHESIDSLTTHFNERLECLKS